MSSKWRLRISIRGRLNLLRTISGKIKRKELRVKEFEKKKGVIEELKEKGLWFR